MKNIEDSKGYPSLEPIISKKNVIILFSAITLLIIIGAILFYRNGVNQVYEDKRNELTAIEALKISQISLWRNERIADIKTVVHSEVLGERFASWLREPNNVVKNEAVFKLIKPLKDNYKYDQIFVCSPDGKLLLSTDSSMSVIDSATYVRVNEIKNSDSIGTPEFYYCSYHQKVHLDIIASLNSESNKHIGTVVFRIDPNLFLYPLIKWWPIPTKTAETLIIKREADYVLFLNEVRHKKNTALNLKIPVTKTDVPAVKAVLGTRGVFEGIDYRGVQVLSSISKIPNTNWLMIAKIDEDEIYSEIKLTTITIFISAIFLILFAGAGLSWIYQYKRRFYYQSLFTKEKELHENQEEFKTTLYSIGDAVITTDNSGKVKYMNSIAEELTGWKETDAVGKDIQDVFHIVSEDTHKVVDEPVKRVIETGRVVGLANHTLLISKQGIERPIADSGAPIMVNGVVSGVVLVFRDQTIDRQHKNALKESEKKYRLLFEHAGLGIGYFSIEGKVISLNQQACSNMEGEPSDFIGKSVTEIYGEELGRVYLSRFKRTIAADEILRFEDEVFLPSGIKWYLSTYQCIKNAENNPECIQIITYDITERKQMEQTLYESEERFRLLYEQSPGAYQSLDNKGNIIIVNQAWMSMLGYSSDEVIGKWFGNFIDKDERDLFRKRFEECKSTDSITGMEYEMICSNGSKIDVSIDSRIAFDSNGNFSQTHCVLKNVSEQKRNHLAKEIRYLTSDAVYSLKNFRTLFDSIKSEASSVFDTKFMNAVVLEENSEDANISKDYSGEDLEPSIRTFTEFVFNFGKISILKKPDLAQILAELQNENKENIPEVFIGIPLRIGSKAIGVMFTYNYSNRNAYSFADLELFEILSKELSIYLERKRARETTSKLSKVIKQSPVSIVITDNFGKIEYVNPQFQRLTGYGVEEVIGKNPRILNSGKHSKEFYEDMWDTILSGRDFDCEILNKKKNGELFWASIIISSIVNENGDITHFVSVTEDITEQKMMMEELVTAKEKAEEMNRVKSFFFANMSHELRTPFVGIMGYAQLLLESLSDTHERELVEGILEASRRLTDTLTKILELTKLEFDVSKPQLANCDIVKLVDEVYAQFTKAAEQKKLSLIKEINIDSLIIYSSERIILSTLYNLVSNAVKFTYKGYVKMSLTTEQKDDAKLLIIVVEDSGIGISQEKQNVIWDEFRQASEGTTRSFQGSGLGLSIAKKNMELLNGIIYLESKVGEGSKFTVVLPIESAADESFQLPDNKIETPSFEQHDETIKDTEDTTLNRKRILYIEDDSSARKIINIILSKYYKVELASTSDEGLVKVKSGQYDAILMDINLGDRLDGLQLTKFIRELPGYDKTPIIAVTAYAAESDKTEFLSKGISAYIAKPFELKEVLQMVKSVLSKS